MPKANENLQGVWYYEGDNGTPCAIFQQGPLLLLINERGDMATGKAVSDANVVVISAREGGWQLGLKAAISETDKETQLTWSNATVWRRPKTK